MRITTKSLLVLSVFSLALTASASAELFEFEGWDHSLIANGGQTFDDICGDLDVTVESIGAFDADTTFEMTMAGGDAAIRSQHSGAGSHSFVFSFSQPIDAYIEFTRLDTEELLGVFGIGPENYTHMGGLSPIMNADGSGMTYQGAGFGADAADGRVTVGPTSILTVTYGSLVNDPTKFLDFNIGKVVPEPASFSMLGLAILGLFGLGRRR